MNLQSMFLKPIDRDIKGVIKVGQKDEENILQELEEYVVTRELTKHFSDFFEAYQKGIDGHTDKMGVWISGFFGSGKSHFLKILSYLLENKIVNGKAAVDYFDEKIPDPLVLANIKRAGNVSSDVILFNIDSKSDYDGKNNKDAIVKVFFKVFYEMQGFYGSKPWIAEMERELSKEGIYQDFKDFIKAETGDEWEERRRKALFDRKLIVKALTKVRNMSEEDALAWFNAKDQNFTLSVEGFAQEVKEYLEQKGNNHHLIFLVDEMGQYIGDNTQLMLNLQTVVEDLGTYCGGKAWVMVTSQQDIDSITKVKGNDFSKIQGRFNTRLSLSSASVDEVIKKRILQKAEVARDTLSLLYNDKSAILRNLISFSVGTAEMKNYADAEDFAESYPFVPYQFRLLQKVFEAIRKHGASGKHLAEGERSMLGSFQESAQMYKDCSLGTLVPFFAFYNSIEKFLDPTISRVIEQAKDNSRLEEKDLDVLKLLFMIKYVKEVPATLENIATLMVSHLDEDKLALKETIQGSLQRLVGQTLIQKNGDEYIFLTDDEQDINKEIKNVLIEEDLLINKVGEIIFEEIYPEKRYRYSKRYDFGFNQQIDERKRGNQTNEFGLKIITPNFDGYEELSEQAIKMMSSKENALLVRLPGDPTFLEELQEALKIDYYLTKKSSSTLPENITLIIQSKAIESRKRKERAKNLLKDSLSEATLYYNADEIAAKAKDPAGRINQGLEVVVKSIYTKLDYLKSFVDSEKDLLTILKATKDQVSLPTDDPNKLAKEEVGAYLERQLARGNKITMKNILDEFKAAPYGWKELDIAGLIAGLLKEHKIRLQYNSEDVALNNKELTSYLTKKSEVEKLIIGQTIVIEPPLLELARKMAKNLFGQTLLSQDADTLMRDFKDLTKEEIDELKSLLGKYEGKSYPGKHIVEDGKALLQSLYNLKNISEFYQKLKAVKDDLEDYEEDIEIVKGFFKNQKEYFDKALKTLAIYKDNGSYVTDREIINLIKELETIISDPNPYGKIVKIPALVDKFNELFALLLEQECAPVKESIKNDYGVVCEEIAKYEWGADLTDVFKSRFNNLLNQIEEVNSFYKAIAMKTESERLRIKCLEKIDEEVIKRKPKIIDPSPEHQPPVDPPKMPISLNLSKIAPVGKVIETEADVDDLLEKLGTKLKEYIRNQQKIRLS